MKARADRLSSTRGTLFWELVLYGRRSWYPLIQRATQKGQRVGTLTHLWPTKLLILYVPGRERETKADLSRRSAKRGGG